MTKKSFKMTINTNKFKHKMDNEELQDHLKLKRGNGAHKNKKAYTRRAKHKDVS
jgi:hypothetical protein